MAYMYMQTHAHTHTHTHTHTPLSLGHLRSDMRFHLGWILNCLIAKYPHQVGYPHYTHTHTHTHTHTVTRFPLAVC